MDKQEELMILNENLIDKNENLVFLNLKVVLYILVWREVRFL